mgnify:CR=1 FL=1|jgi:hypothetical protein
MKIKFENGNEFESIHTDSSIRSKRSKIIGCNCYDTKTNTWVFHELFIENPIDRYIPEWLYTE